MDANLNLAQLLVAFGDTPPTANPSLKYFDWQQQLNNLPVSNPLSRGYSVDPNDTLSVFSGTRSTSIDNTTEFDMALSSIPGETSRYRFAWSGTGTSPDLRTDRGLDLSGVAVTVTVNANSTATFTASAGDFTGSVVGDALYLGDATFGDEFNSSFNTSNLGYWTIISVAGDGSSITAQRPTGDPFSALAEVATPVAAEELQVFSAAGVQVGDKVAISAGFSVYVRNTYSVDRVNPAWFEIVATGALPVAETAVPDTSGIVFYTAGKRLLFIAADQECAVRVNGDSGSTQRLSPWQAGDASMMGWYLKCGPAWSLDVVNLTPSTLNLVVISAE